VFDLAIGVLGYFYHGYQTQTLAQQQNRLDFTYQLLVFLKF
jgi:hypothetical protein